MRRPRFEILIPALLAAGAAGAAEQLVDGIAAQVGSDIVLVSEVMHASRSSGDEVGGAPSRSRRCAPARSRS
jgi:hypothetical protein